MLPVGTTGEGAPGHQPPTTEASEEVQLAPTPTPVVSTFLHYFYKYLAFAQYSATTLSTHTWPCNELGLIFPFVHRHPALKHCMPRGGSRRQRRSHRRRWRRRRRPSHLPPRSGKRVTPLGMPCYFFLHTVQCGVRVTLLHLVRGILSSPLLFYCRSDC